MPDRENEHWLNESDSLRYCVIHKRYYDVRLGCQFCWLETNKRSEKSHLQKCPDCSKVSLFYNTITEMYECLNLKCQRQISKIELDEITVVKGKKIVGQKSKTKAKFQKVHAIKEPNILPEQQMLKCPICLYETLKWVPERSVYECQYDKCHGRTFTREELEEIKRKKEEPVKGKGWFGNEYWDPKKKRWRKK